jgi:hypothetical protein
MVLGRNYRTISLIISQIPPLYRCSAEHTLVLHTPVVWDMIGFDVATDRVAGN